MRLTTLIPFATLLLLSFLIQAQQKERVEIGILADQFTSETDLLIEKLQQEIRSVVGEDAELVFPKDLMLESHFNPKESATNYDQLVAKGCDIVLVFGIVDYVVLTQKSDFTIPTIVFGGAPNDFGNQKPQKSKNLALLSDSHTIANDLNSLKSIYDYSSIAVAMEEAFVSNFNVDAVLSEQLSGVTYRVIPFGDVDDIIENIEDEEALYLGGGFLLTDNEIEQLSEELIERKIPSFTSTGVQDVEIGLLASNQSTTTVDQLFRRIALTVEAIINDENPSDLSSNFDSQEQLSVNIETATLLGLQLRFSQLAVTNIIGDVSNLEIEKTYNLREIMLEAIDKNLSLQSSNKNIELVEQDIKTAKSNYLPNISAGATGSYVDPALAEVSNGQNPEISTSGNLTLSQTVYSAAASANIKIQKEVLGAQQETYNADKLDAIFNAANAYFNILLVKSNLQINERNLDVTERNLELAEQRFEAGEAGKSDILRFKSQRAQNTQSLIEASNQLNQTIISLNQLLNYPLDRKINVEDPELGVGLFEQYNYDQVMELLDNPATTKPFISFLVQEAKENAPELKALNYNVNATNLNYALSQRGRFFPTVALQGQYIRNFNRSGAGSEFPVGFPAIPDGYYTAGVSVSIPIFQQNQQNINQQTAQIQLDQLGINYQNLNLSIEQGVNNAVLELTNQIANIELSKVSEEAARESLDLTQESYSQGAVNRVQLIDAQDNYFQAQLANATAVYSYLLSVLQLERTIGMYFLLNTKEENDAFTQKFTDYLQNR
ncbi:TolC family protein [Ekhidna sp.]